jgi:hypothetical protein
MPAQASGTRHNAQPRIVSVPEFGSINGNPEGIFCHDISEFESYHLVSAAMFGLRNYAQQQAQTQSGSMLPKTLPRRKISTASCVSEGSLLASAVQPMHQPAGSKDACCVTRFDRIRTRRLPRTWKLALNAPSGHLFR